MRHFFKAAILCFMLLALVACKAGKQDYETGMQLAQSGKYVDAIAYLEQAITKEPKNKEYKQELVRLKGELVGQYVSDGQSALAIDPLTIEAVDQAKNALGKAKQIDSGAPDVQHLAQSIADKETDLLTRVKQLYADAQNAMFANEWTKAYFDLQQIQSTFPNYEKTAQLLAQTQRDGGKFYYEKAHELFKAEKFDEAIPLLRNALALDSGSAQAREMLALAQKNNSKGYFIQEGNDARVAQKWDRAVQMYERALSFGPDAKLESLIKHVKLKAGEFYVQDARGKMNDGWLLKAIQTYNLAAKYMSSGSDFMLNSLKTDLVKRSVLLAEGFKMDGKYGSAWYWYEQVRIIDPAYPNIFFLVQEMQDRIRQRVQKSIAVFDFGSPSDHKDAGVIVANNLITYLFKNASGDIKILERENLKSILEEMKLGQIGVVTESTAKEMGRVYGIDVAIMGSVLLYRVDSSVSQGVKTVRYKVGDKITDNIEFLNWKAKHPNPNKEQLAAAPQAKIVSPEYAEKDYAVAEHKKVAFAQLSFRIVDVATGENVQVKTIERRRVVQDEVSAGVREANIEYDPLVMPTDTELLQGLTEEVVAEMGQEALKPLRNLEQVYFKQGENYIRRRENIVAAEKFVDAVFDEKMKGVNTPVSSLSKSNLEQIFLKYRVAL